MHSRIQHYSIQPDRRKGIKAALLVEGLIPGLPNDLFYFSVAHSRMVGFLLAKERGFVNATPHYNCDSLIVYSEPQNPDQFRLAFALTLIEELYAVGKGKLAVAMTVKGNGIIKRIDVRNEFECIKVLEAIEAVESALVAYNCWDPLNRCFTKGTIEI